ncbi:MAG TPA: amino acid adenylation domain-containing protein, partial [Candidatus Deferrimicrobium sp.]|nr:amino acid adenylation domain-containing protein [Candidatus Deferrimicrobium sp.]
TRTNPDHRMFITNCQLNEQAGRLAGWLIDKGVRVNDIIAMVMERSCEMITGILGILKSGGAYLPIDPSYPQERIDYMLKDSGAKIKIGNHFPVSNSLKIASALPHFPASNSANLAYIIYTSGSTGKPKGVLTQHFNVLRVVKNTNYIEIVPRDRLLQLSNYAFDGSVFDIYGALLNGAALLLIGNETVSAVDRLAETIRRQQITVFFVTTALFNVLVDFEMASLKNVRKILFGGERVSVEHAGKALSYLGKGKIIHVYGPTETTVYASYFFVDEIAGTAPTIPIGKPLANTMIYILDTNMNPSPIGVSGEIYIGGKGTARGYLNNPELTAEKFDRDLWDNLDKQDKNKSFFGGKGAIFSKKAPCFYKTGDLGRWLADGNIEFLGRIDNQVKLRGFRVELSEIESHLLKIEGLKEALVLLKEGFPGTGQYLCAYLVTGKRLPDPELRELLAKSLPYYMIPAHFVYLEKMPLTANGKIDVRALPEPSIEKEGAFQAPRDNVEEKMASLWAEVLGIPKKALNIDADFFQMGGHSLKATLLAAKIHKTFQVNVSLTEIFKTPTIRGLANYINAAVKDRYVSLEPAEKKEYYRLSSAQKRLYVLQQMDRQGVGYNIPSFSLLTGEIDKDRIEHTFRVLLNRHESLRTSFHIIGDVPVQRIHDQVEFEIEPLTNEEFIRPFDISRAPLIRVRLTKTGEKKHLLMVDMHHIISDGTSMNILVNDFMALYQGKDLPGHRVQYKDFSEWQHNESRQRQEDYQLKQLAGELPVLALPADYARPVVQSFAGNSTGFEIAPETLTALKT